MLLSIGIKDGIILYHVGYGTALGCRTTSGVTSCGQPICWITDIGLVTKLDYICVYCIGSPTWVIGVLDTTRCKEFQSFSFINLLNFSSTKGKFLNSCWSCWQYAQVNVVSIVGWVVVIGIFRWTNGRSMVPMTGTLGQTIWWSGCVC